MGRVKKDRIPESFPEKFRLWLADNWHVWEAFEAEAMRAVRRGFRHYSSKTIIHFLRHHSAVREDSNWKINNNWSPYLARLFDHFHPRLAGLWEYRDVKSER